MARSYIVKREESVHFYLIPCWARCSPDHSRRNGQNLFMTMETCCVEHAGRARVMFERGGVCFLAIMKMAQLQTHICLGSSTESATAAWRGYS